MNLPPITLFGLAAVIGALGGLWHVVSQDERQRWKDYFDGVLGGGLIGLALSLLLYEKLGTTEFGACTLLGLSLLLSMAGKAGFRRLLEGAARQFLGEDRRGGYSPVPSNPRPLPRVDPPRVDPAPEREETTERECNDDQQDSGPEMSTWP